MSRQADIKQAITAIPVAVAKDDEASAIAAGLMLVEGALIDLARIADALETIARNTTVSAHPLRTGGDAE